jgi:hypothetical protein
VHQLPADRTHGHARVDPRDLDRARPASRCNDHGAARQRSAIRLDDNLLVARGNPAHAALFDELRAVATRGLRERARQVRGGDEAVRLDQQAADDAVADERLLRARTGRVEEQRGHAAALEHSR